MPIRLTIGELVEVVCAAHLSVYVEGPFKSRGGLMLVGPPAAMKTSVLNHLKAYPHAQVISDITSQSLTRIQQDIASARIHTVAVQDYQKLYERHPMVASNIEGNIRSLIDEGFTCAAHQEARLNRPTARAVFMGAVTPDLLEKKGTAWLDGGFARRFLWFRYSLSDPDTILQSIADWNPVRLEHPTIPTPKGPIPFTLTQTEKVACLSMIQDQYGKEIPYILIMKVLCVIKWHFDKQGKSAKQALELLSRFSAGLKKEACEVDVSNSKKKGNKKDATKDKSDNGKSRTAKPAERIDVPSGGKLDNGTVRGGSRKSAWI